MKESEASNKVCPFIRYPDSEDAMRAVYYHQHCVAHNCMSWKKHAVSELVSDPESHCKLLK